MILIYSPQNSSFHLDLLIISYFSPLFLGIKETRRLRRLKWGYEAKEAPDAGGYRLGDEPGKIPKNLAKLSAKGG